MTTFAFVFPGQGSQAVGMLNGWEDHPAVAETVQEASDALGENLGRLIQEGPQEALSLTTNTQPVMLVAGVAAWRVLRAAAMQKAVPVGTGAMAAILGLEAARVAQLCAEVTQSMGTNSGEVVEAVNFNDPAQTVIAGSKAAVDQACQALKAAGAKRALLLPVSAPFHSSLMKPAAEKLRAALADTSMAPPQLDVINNIDVAVVQDADAIRDALYRQAFGPVRWVECVQALKAHGVTHLVECGPGKVLAGLARRIDPTLVGAPLYDLKTLQEVKELLA